MGRSGWQNCKLMILVTCILTQTHYSLFRHVTYHSTVSHATSNLGQNCLQVLPAVTTLAAVILRVQVKLLNLKNEGKFTFDFNAEARLTVSNLLHSCTKGSCE